MQYVFLYNISYNITLYYIICNYIYILCSIVQYTRSAQYCVVGNTINETCVAGLRLCVEKTGMREKGLELVDLELVGGWE